MKILKELGESFLDGLKALFILGGLIYIICLGIATIARWFG